MKKSTAVVLTSVGFAFLSHQLVETWGPFKDVWEPSDCSQARGLLSWEREFQDKYGERSPCVTIKERFPASCLLQTLTD